jgi:hypothetical protein
MRRQWTDIYGFRSDPDGQGGYLDYTDTITHHPGTIHGSADQLRAFVAEMDAKANPATNHPGGPVSIDITYPLEQLAVDLVDAQARFEKAQEDLDAVKDAIRRHPHVHGPDTYQAGNLTVLVQPNTRFDQNLAGKAIPEELLPLVTVEKVTTTIDRKKVEVLAPDFLEACIAHYDDKVIVK